MNSDDIADRNVEQLNFTAGALDKMERQRGLLPRTRTLPGSRSDGGMAQQPREVQSLLDQILHNDQRLRADLVDAHNTIDNLERDIAKLESELASERAHHDAEQAKRKELEDILRKAAEIMINGNKS